MTNATLSSMTVSSDLYLDIVLIIQGPYTDRPAQPWTIRTKDGRALGRSEFLDSAHDFARGYIRAMEDYREDGARAREEEEREQRQAEEDMAQQWRDHPRDQ